jgi:hypothetical protein
MELVLTYTYEFRSKGRGIVTAIKASQTVLTQSIAKIFSKKNAFGLVLSAFFGVHYYQNSVRWNYNQEGRKK